MYFYTYDVHAKVGSKALSKLQSKTELANKKKLVIIIYLSCFIANVHPLLVINRLKQ